MSKLSPEAIVAAGVREKAISFAVDGSRSTAFSQRRKTTRQKASSSSPMAGAASGPVLLIY